MLDQQTQLFPTEDAGMSETTYRLERLEVFNWGPFSGLHRADFDAHGTAIIGPTGSGKTTLVDALMTLLVSYPRYNLASTGGHESDRTLLSYVRGVLGGDGADGCDEVARPGKTLTGICATYHGGSDTETLRLAALLWTEGASNATEDLKRRWIFSQAEEQTLEVWLRQHHENGIRELMRIGRDTARLRIFDSKTAYLVHVRKFFDVGENAFTLLNRAAGLKQLNSIDEIFRDLVLDDHSAFERALEVAGEFDNLAEIHTELERARRQQDSLKPIAEDHQRLLKANAKVARWRTLKQIVPVWFAILGQRKWRQEQDRLRTMREGWELRLLGEREQEAVCAAQVETLRERYLELGGNVIGELEKTISIQSERVAERAKYAMDYRRLVGAFCLSDELTRETLLHNQALLGKQREGIQKEHDAQEDKRLIAFSEQRSHEDKYKETELMFRKVKERPGSNIPPLFQDFRAELADALAVPEGTLPFLAELVEVKPDESPWRGAIERAIGSDRLRVLVPEDHLEHALHWVNHRHNRVHVRLQRARRREESTTFFPDGYSCKLNFKPHPLLPTAKRLLASRDLHCVDSPTLLATTEHGLTIEGTMSGRHGRFEKQDQRRLNEDWMTGFDNKDQLDVLVHQLESYRAALKRWQAATEEHRLRCKGLNQQLSMIDELTRLEFAVIDLPGAEAELALSQNRLAALLSPDSNASQAKAQYDLEAARLKSVESEIRKLDREIAVLDKQLDDAAEEVRKAEIRAGRGLTEEERALAEQDLTVPPDTSAQNLGDEERRAERWIDENLTGQQQRVTDIEQRLVRQMEVARNEDTGALAEVGSTLEDVPFYLERLRVLTQEALPEKRSRFLEYLNRSSDQGVTQLLAGIAEEVDAIEQRIRELNQTLVKVDFRSGRYLQLKPQRIKHERLRSLEAAMRKVRSAALKDDEGESHYKALCELVEILRDAGGNRRQMGSRALLDPRYRLQFFVVEVDRHTGNQSPPRTGSQSGSGGEKELMASHILTASLSYALCPTGTSRPLYGTVILDEAFSKSSPSAAGRIIDALRIFHLHPVFITPNKEIGLLKRHTRKVICVQRPAREASLASISWEKLDELAHRS